MLKRHELVALWPSDPKICQVCSTGFVSSDITNAPARKARDLATIVLILFQDGRTEEADLLYATSGTSYFATPLMKAARESALAGAQKLTSAWEARTEKPDQPDRRALFPSVRPQADTRFS